MKGNWCCVIDRNTWHGEWPLPQGQRGETHVEHTDLSAFSEHAHSSALYKLWAWVLWALIEFLSCKLCFMLQCICCNVNLSINRKYLFVRILTCTVLKFPAKQLWPLGWNCYKPHTLLFHEVSLVQFIAKVVLWFKSRSAKHIISFTVQCFESLPEAAGIITSGLLPSHIVFTVSWIAD